jgi:hypothetical protein
MSSRLMDRRPLAGAAAAVALLALPLFGAAAQAVPSWPGDSIARRAAPVHPVYVDGPVAPTLPSDTLFGTRLSANAAVPRYPIAPTMPGDVVTRPPQWLLDTLRADSIRQGLIPDPLADTPPADSLGDPARVGRDTVPPDGMQLLPDQHERTDSLRAAPDSALPPGTPARPRRSMPGDAVRRS